jgi:hypothetical protein
MIFFELGYLIEQLFANWGSEPFNIHLLNAETLRNQVTNKKFFLFGIYWLNKTGSVTELTLQTNGAILLEAVLLLTKEGLLN